MPRARVIELREHIVQQIDGLSIESLAQSIRLDKPQREGRGSLLTARAVATQIARSVDLAHRGYAHIVSVRTHDRHAPAALAICTRIKG
jgi:hypothetical protein